jgi:hypothetical protein
MSENRYLKEEPKEEELFDEVRKLFNLKRTVFIVDKKLLTSECNTDTEDGITRCYLQSIDDAIHEGVHAFFEERSQKLWEQLEEEGYISRIENIVTVKHLEEVTARLVEVNFQNILLEICTEDVQKTVRFMSERTRFYENIELGKKIIRLYTSIYDFNCICPKDIKFYDNIKKDIDPIIVYNKLAKYVGTKELI